MGGSGGNYFFDNSKDAEEISRKIRNEEEHSKDASYETGVSRLISDLLNNVDYRNNDTISTHIDTVVNAINSEIEGNINLKYGGSIAKHTYVDGLSDVDTLAILNKTALVNATPSEVKEYFIKRLRERLPNTEIKEGNLAVTIKFKSGVELQILPAIRTATGIKIASPDSSNTWSNVIRPDNFTKLLRYSNIKMSGKLVPVIKLAKSLISSFPEQRRLSGYHVEALAIESFTNYTGPKTTKEMLKHFFREGSKNVLSPVKDKTGQSVHVDDYLGGHQSLQRKMASDSLSTLARKMQNADGGQNIGIWEQILK